MKIWSARRFLTDGISQVLPLYPFWGLPADPGWPREDFADDLVEHGVPGLELVELEEADLAVFPNDWESALSTPHGRELLDEFLAVARAANVPACLFWYGGRPGPPAPEGVISFQPSLFRSQRTDRDFGVPRFHEDLLAHYCNGELPLREKGDRACVTFCGAVPRPPRPKGAIGRARRLAGDTRRSVAVRRGKPLEEDVYVRGAAVDALRQQQHVDTNIVVRDGHNGGPGLLHPLDNLDLWLARRAEYVDNILDGDYVLCARGQGNFSVRLTEVLSLGRIPVFVDTDCVLPGDFAIDWPSHGIWLDRRSVKDIGARVADFHRRLTEDEFVALQRRNRALWEEWLSPAGFVSKLETHLDRARALGALA